MEINSNNQQNYNNLLINPNTNYIDKININKNDFNTIENSNLNMVEYQNYQNNYSMNKFPFENINNNLDYKNIPNQILNLPNQNNNLNKNQNLQNNDGADIIFNHVYINIDGQKYIPNTNNQIYFDQNTMEYILPEEIIKEDNITKMLRIKAILDSIDFQNIDITNKFKINDPPIIEGIENFLKQINKKEKDSIEKIETQIIKKDYENVYFLNKHDMDQKIREPPNFLM